jgi:hypothetical protein
LKKDLEFIAGDFFEVEIPKSKQYLWKYFTTDIQRQFVRYYLTFGSTERFVAHTGCFCRKRWLQLLVAKFKRLEATLKQAKESFDFETVAAIESGKYEL